MGETFLININCSKILTDGDEAKYTMFIDSSKMSIVYELVEWIRWMFSLENCIYITHNNSVIHELEDIQLLSRLQNFELKPCGRTNCVHKKVYRTLLKNLNLFVSWNGKEVHKYFLHKLQQVDQKLTSECDKTSPKTPAKDCNFLDYRNTKFDNTKNIRPENDKFFLCDNNLPKVNKEVMSPAKKRTIINNYGTNNEISFDKKLKSSESLNYSQDSLSESHYSGCENFTLEPKNSIRTINTSPGQNKLNTIENSSKNSKKSKKYVKPFSLGEILSSIREDFEKQKTEQTTKTNSPPPCPSVLKEEDFDVENSSVTEIKKEGRKRKRTRKRKSKKGNLEEEFISPFLDKNTSCSNMDKSNDCLKPNHIRFDSDDEDNQMEAEFGDDVNLKTKNEILCKDLIASNGFLHDHSKEVAVMASNNTTDLSGIVQVSSEMNNTENKMDCSFATEEKLIDLEDEPSHNSSQLYAAQENLETNQINPDLNMLLSLKEKYKNAVIIERFY